jgi:hypothetical protein
VAIVPANIARSRAFTLRIQLVAGRNPFTSWADG